MVVAAIKNRVVLPMLKTVVGSFNRYRFHGERFACPICQARLCEMFPFGNPLRPNAICPVCRSVERHRFLWIVMHRRGLLKQHGLRMLHAAPEWVLERKLRRLPSADYLSIDLMPGKAMQAMDLTALRLADETFELALCLHVLEHIPEDLNALRELHRVLRRNATLLVQVPQRCDQPTVESADATTPSERFSRFGQIDHVRLYGTDLADRLQRIGFHVTVHDPRIDLSAEDYRRFSLADGTAMYSIQSIVYECRKLHS